jgi:hypothetical protein
LLSQPQNMLLSTTPPLAVVIYTPSTAPLSTLTATIYRLKIVWLIWRLNIFYWNWRLILYSILDVGFNFRDERLSAIRKGVIDLRQWIFCNFRIQWGYCLEAISGLQGMRGFPQFYVKNFVLIGWCCRKGVIETMDMCRYANNKGGWDAKRWHGAAAVRRQSGLWLLLGVEEVEDSMLLFCFIFYTMT